jgi:hypothetical protein
MSPEEKTLLERTLKLSEENNLILHKIQKRAKWSTIFGLIKIVVIVVPLVAGYIYFQPFLEQAVENYSGVKEILNTLN